MTQDLLVLPKLNEILVLNHDIGQFAPIGVLLICTVKLSHEE
ncbi:hypothetical protein FB2170_14478 [Maribacter sp. HTCC2170]|nr:hypothetical protein FB2170_14478 [Maribacter sp. HTCC2170]